MSKKRRSIRQAGAITVRETKKGLEVLLVRAKKNPRDWIFPKGHVEKGESLAETAARELLEEGGVIGDPVRRVGVSTFRSDDEEIEVTYFLVRYRRRRGTAERETRWRSFSDAKKRLTYKDARAHLDAVRRMLKED